ncbi:MAG: hypothetical protein SOT08_05400, partial [Candidatus Borkfalkiaceae bacterium]|nr:hypothetical protein [Christensenellaceae bacterium]
SFFFFSLPFFLSAALLLTAFGFVYNPLYSAPLSAATLRRHSLPPLSAALSGGVFKRRSYADARILYIYTTS